MNGWGLVVQIVLALGGLGGIAAVILIPAQIRKLKGESQMSEATAAEKLSAASVAILAPATEELARLQARLTEALAHANILEERLRASQAEVADLRNQVTIMTKELVELRNKG